MDMSKYLSSDSYALLMALRCGYADVERAQLTGHDNWLTRWYWRKYVEWHPDIKASMVCLLKQLEQKEAREKEAWLTVSREEG